MLETIVYLARDIPVFVINVAIAMEYPGHPFSTGYMAQTCIMHETDLY